jgi:hypothetical protein
MVKIENYIVQLHFIALHWTIAFLNQPAYSLPPPLEFPQINEFLAFPVKFKHIFLWSSNPNHGNSLMVSD